MTAMTDTPRIYVASLSDYNAGRLHGRWIDADQDAEAIAEEVSEMLAESPEPGAEEWAIHDYDGFGSIRLGEWESFETVATLAALIEEHGAAFAAWYENEARDLDTCGDDFAEEHAGEWDSLADYAYELFRDTAPSREAVEMLDQWPFSMVDWERAGEELRIGGDVYAVDCPTGGVWVFRNV